MTPANDAPPPPAPPTSDDDAALIAHARESLRYARFEPEDAARLIAAGPRVRAAIPGVAQAFYDHMREHEIAHGVLRDEAQVLRLRAALERWIASAFDGVYDDAYWAGLVRIGHAHVDAAVPQRLLPASISLLRGGLSEAIRAHGGAWEEERALHRLLDAQAAVLVDVYEHRNRARIDALERDESRALRQKLATLESAHPEVVDLAQLLVIGVDAEANVAFVSTELSRVTGWGRDEIVGRPLAQLFHGGNEPEAMVSGRAAIASGAVRRVELEAELAVRHGPPRLVRLGLARPIELAGPGTGVALLVIARDVTDERAQAESLHHVERLAAMGTLIAGLAHEIRNPLHGAMLHLRVLERALRAAPLERDAAEAMATIDRETKRLSTLLDEFLDFARPKPLTRTQVGLSALGQQALATVREQAERANVTLVADLPAVDVVLDADAERLGCALVNLLRNAIEAIAGAQPKGRVTLRVRREPSRASIEVIDDGPGLKRPDEPVFDVFYSTKAHGTGLGLPLAHRIVNDHGGELVVDSSPGATTFRAILPLVGAGVPRRRGPP